MGASVDMSLLGLAGALLVIWMGLVRLLEWAWFRPKRLERALRAQGLKGTPVRFLYGDLQEMARVSKEAESKPMSLSHNIVPRVGPWFHQAMEKYGKISFTWTGPKPMLTLMDPEMVREVLSNKSGQIEVPKEHPLTKYLTQGLSTLQGEKWAKHRRIINPAFHLEKLKRMLPAFSICCDELIERWDESIGAKGSCELDVWPEFQSFTGDVISRAAFGSSFKEGRRIFQLQYEQGALLMAAFNRLYLPGYRFLPTKQNKRMKEINNEVALLLTRMIEHREQALKNENYTSDDLLGLLLESNRGNQFDLTTNDVIEECKMFYFAGHETTSVLMTWTTVALAMHPTWQARAREEVLRVLGKSKPSYDDLSKLKTVTMILYEVLRLYPPVTFIARETHEPLKLGDLTLLPGVELVLPIIYMQHDKDFWGSDADEFNPDRFADGLSKAAKVPGAFIPFGGGPRICIGQNFAMLEAKMCLARILQNFSFELSPSYAHAPHVVLTLHPQYGAQIIIHRI